MTELMRRRRALMGQKREIIDTTPKIMETGVYWNRNRNKVSNSNYAITEKYEPDIPGNSAVNAFSLYLGIQTSDAEHRYVVYKDGATNPFDHWTVGQPRFSTNGKYVSFSILISEIDDCYVYVLDTGTVLFAGRNTPYYGKRNIND